MVNGPDYNVVQGFDKLWQQATIHDVENGQTRGINKEEFDGMSLFLNEAIKNPNATAETKNWAQKKLDDLNVMKDSVFNKDQLKKDVEANSPKGLWDNIKDCFTKTEKDYLEENVISSNTMFAYDQGGIDAVKDGNRKHSIFGFGNMFGVGNMLGSPTVNTEE